MKRANLTKGGAETRTAVHRREDGGVVRVVLGQILHELHRRQRLAQKHGANENGGTHATTRNHMSTFEVPHPSEQRRSRHACNLFKRS